jgi:hypothetical protein
MSESRLKLSAKVTNPPRCLGGLLPPSHYGFNSPRLAPRFTPACGRLLRQNKPAQPGVVKEGKVPQKGCPKIPWSLTLESTLQIDHHFRGGIRRCLRYGNLDTGEFLPHRLKIGQDRDKLNTGKSLGSKGLTCVVGNCHYSGCTSGYTAFTQ